MKKESHSGIIFDFDGTIVDSFQMSLEAMYDLAHHNLLPREDSSRLRGMTTLQLLRELRIPVWQAPFLARRTRRHLAWLMDEVELINGIDKTIQILSIQYKVFILTSNDTENVREVLARHGLNSYITDVLGDANPWRKEHSLRKLKAQYDLHPETTWYVGDSVWDVRAAHRAGLKAVAVAWGFSNIHVLKYSKPDYLVFSTDELTRCL